MKKRYWQILAAILALILSQIACGQPITPTPTTTVTTPAPIVIVITATPEPPPSPTPTPTPDCTGCEERGKP